MPEESEILYCKALYLCIYTTLLAVHTNQCEIPREKRYITLPIGKTLSPTSARELLAGLTRHTFGADVERSLCGITGCRFVLCLVNTEFEGSASILQKQKQPLINRDLQSISGGSDKLFSKPEDSNVFWAGTTLMTS